MQCKENYVHYLCNCSHFLVVTLRKVVHYLFYFRSLNMILKLVRLFITFAVSISWINRSCISLKTLVFIAALHLKIGLNSVSILKWKNPCEKTLNFIRKEHIFSLNFYKENYFKLLLVKLRQRWPFILTKKFVFPTARLSESLQTWLTTIFSII